jgi:predicted tellurium resistance membrane protein TerC
MDPFSAITALLTLTAMEIVLGIDNVVFIAILCGRLPEEQQPLGRRLGLAVALITRLLLLCLLYWMLDPENSVFTYELVNLTDDLGLPASWLQDKAGVLQDEINSFTVQDLVLFVGGLFLIGKSVHEVHDTMEGESASEATGKAVSFTSVMMQVALLDVVFSLDSVITAVGMAEDLWVMATAIIIAVGVMLVFADRISGFIEANPTVKMLALSFLILIGVMLTAEAMGMHIKKGYIYFAMAFALLVEMLNMRARRKTV